MSLPHQAPTLHHDATLVGAVAVLSGLLATVAGCQPTGTPVADAIICFCAAAFVTWAGATAPTWALVLAASGVGAANLGQPAMFALSVVALGAAVAIALAASGQTALRALVAGLIVQLVLRLEWSPVFAGSAMVAAATAVLLVGTGLRRRSPDVRLGASRLAIVAGVLVALALGGFVAGAIQARASAGDGYDRLLDALNLLRAGDPDGAAAAFHDASTLLDDAHERLDSPWTQPSRAVPVLAQHRSSIQGVIDHAAVAADAAADALEFVDLDALTLTDGAIDLEAVSVLAAPLAALEESLTAMRLALDDADSPWLAPPLRDRLDRAMEETAEVEQQTARSRLAAEQLPAMLGGDGQRRYLVAVTTGAEARGQSGAIVGWTELVASGGKLRVAGVGAVDDLVDALAAGERRPLDATAEFFERYGDHGAGTARTPVAAEMWRTVTMPADAPAAAAVAAQLYEQTTGRTVDAVAFVDTAGLVALGSLVDEELLEAAGVPPEGITPTGLDALGANAVLGVLLTASLPPPPTIGATLGPAAAAGHLVVWSNRASEQLLMERLGVDGALPPLEGRDGLGVVTNNLDGSHVDAFVEREIRYESTCDAKTGKVEAIAAVTLTNRAPNEGGDPSGTSRTLVSLYSAQDLAKMELTGRFAPSASQTEAGWQVHSTEVELGPSERATLRFELEGGIEAQSCDLVIRPQPGQPAHVSIIVEAPDGTVLSAYGGEITGRSVLAGTGLTPVHRVP